MSLPSIDKASLSGWPEEIVLRLGTKPFSIHGRVVDQAGQALAGITVLTPDASKFGLEMEPGAAWGSMRTLEELAGGSNSVSTDAEGQFELKGLQNREYRLQLVESGSLLSSITSPIAPGPISVELLFRRDTIGTIAGRIVDRNGRGLPDVTVAVSLKRPDSLDIGHSDITDSEGQFRLEGVTLNPEFLRLTGRQIVADLFRTLPPATDLEQLELQVSRLCRFQVQWGSAAQRASELILVDADERPIDMLSTEGGGYGISASLPVTQGYSQMVSITEETVQAILKRDGQEVERFPVQPIPGELFLLQP